MYYYKGYEIERAYYLHDEDEGTKYWIVLDGIIVKGAESVSDAKRIIDNDEIDVEFPW